MAKNGLEMDHKWHKTGQKWAKMCQKWPKMA